MAILKYRHRRVFYGALMITVVFLGLGIRALAPHISGFIADYAPDALWALLVYAIVVVAAPRLSAGQAAGLAGAFALAIECSQLYQAPWINDVRATRIGGLVLGYGFLWSDLLCYVIGIAAGLGLDTVLWPRSRPGDMQGERLKTTAA